MKSKSSVDARAVGAILSRPYSRILIPQEDGRFSAEILEFPGCFSEGDSPQAAYSHLEDAAEAWVASCLSAGTPVPEPLTSYDASGRFLLRLPRSLYARAAKAAARERVSLNQYVTNALAERLGSQVAIEGLKAVLTEMKQLAYAALSIRYEKFAASSSSGESFGIPDGVKVEQSASTSTTSN